MDTREPMSRFMTRLAWATLVPVAVMIVAMALKPMWRDEYWSLYFTEPRFSLIELFNGRMHWETHPPLYFVFLAVWRTISDADIWIRALALPFLAAGAIGAWALGRGLRETGLFLLMCAGSYWVIYFATEARPYTLLFVLCAWSTLILARAFAKPEHAPSWAIGWALTGAAIAMTHYFGGLWVACAGLSAGVAFLVQRRFGAFLAFGVASTMALLPVAYWLYLSLPMLGERGGNTTPGPDEWSIFLTQVSRGLTIKLLGSNLALSAAVFAGAAALWRQRAPIDRVLLSAAVLFVVIAAALDLLWSPMIKERTFTPMIPALIVIMARAVLSLDVQRPWARRFLYAAPIVAAISPLLFIPEYFKDRERFVDVRALIRTEAAACAGSPVLAYMRERWNDDTYQREVIERQLRQATPEGVTPVQIVSLAELADNAAPPPLPGCRLRAIALVLRPGEREEHAEARAALARAGVNIEALEERRFGKGRNLVWLAPADPESQPDRIQPQ